MGREGGFPLQSILGAQQVSKSESHEERERITFLHVSGDKYSWNILYDVNHLLNKRLHLFRTYSNSL